MKKTILLILVIFLVILLHRFVGKFDFVLIDYTHYIEAAKRIAVHSSPYKSLEYFSPPWFAILLIPLTYFPDQVGSLVWIIFLVIANLLAVAAWIAYFAYSIDSRRRLILTTLFALAAPSLYVYVTGQVSSIAFLCLTYLLFKMDRSWKGIAATTTGITFKPHLSALPLFLYLLESFRNRRISPIFRISTTVFSLMVLSSYFYPNWLEEWLQALLKGDYRGGSGLVSAGYFGFREAGVPIWLLILPSLYVIFTWYKEGLTPYVISFSLISNLLIIPYHRAYDYILLYPACLLILVHSAKSTSTLTARFLVVLSIWMIPFTSFVLLSPALVLIALLILRVESSTRLPIENKSRQLYASAK